VMWRIETSEGRQFPFREAATSQCRTNLITGNSKMLHVEIVFYLIIRAGNNMS
jgi:hypothetical protein